MKLNVQLNEQKIKICKLRLVAINNTLAGLKKEINIDTVEEKKDDDVVVVENQN